MSVAVSDLRVQNNLPDYATLRANWLTFVEKHQLEPGVEPFIANSWMRCYPHLNPQQPLPTSHLSLDVLEAADNNANIRLVGRRVMEDIYEHLEGTNTAIMLVNSLGYIIDILGDPEILAMMEEHGLRQGEIYSEPYVGTNAFALTLAERVPAQVRGPEHFIEQFHIYSEAAAPIFDISGKLLGSVGLVNLFEEHYPHTLSLAVGIAQTIINQRSAEQLMVEQNNQITQINAILSVISEGVLLWNAEGFLLQINDAAEKIIRLPRQAILGKHYRDFISLPSWLEGAIQERQSVDIATARVRVGNRSLNLVISVHFSQTRTGTVNIIVTLHKEVDLMQISQNRAAFHSTNLSEIILGNSIHARRVRSLAQTAASARASVLIRGERGTGKNVLATAIHNNGPRRDEPFIFFACASTPENQMASELLGYDEKGSSSEPWDKPGKIELAQGGTMYFQDIDHLTLEAQVILLEALKLGIVRDKKSRHAAPADVRVIASSSANLEDLIAEGRFHLDLYYRLSAFDIVLPPLRNRIEDLPVLAEEFLKRISRQVNEPYRLSEAALIVLKSYDWPGNLRELEAVMRLASSQARGAIDILPEHLPEFVFHPSGQEKSPLHLGRIASLQEIEAEALIQSARHLRGNVTQMAQALGISRTTLWRKLREFGISVDDFRNSRI